MAIRPCRIEQLALLEREATVRVQDVPDGPVEVPVLMDRLQEPLLRLAVAVGAAEIAENNERMQ
jgi:hypothetical protein